MADFQFYFQSGKQRKIRLMEDDSHVVSVRNSLVKK
jgi:hypothetical protein